MYTVPSTLVGRCCSHGTVYTCGSPCRPPWDQLGLAWAQFIKGHLLSKTPGGPAGGGHTSAGAGWAPGRAGGAMGRMAVCPAPSSGFRLSILKALDSLLWGWGLTEVVPRLPWSCEGSPKEAGGWGWLGARWAGLPGSEAHLPCWRPPAGLAVRSSQTPRACPWGPVLASASRLGVQGLASAALSLVHPERKVRNETGGLDRRPP